MWTAREAALRTLLAARMSFWTARAFHTKLLYDVDRSFASGVVRGLIVLTIYGETLPTRVMVLPYYPLPVSVLDRYMADAGLLTRVFPARQGLASNSRYDIVVGAKQR